MTISSFSLLLSHVSAPRVRRVPVMPGSVNRASLIVCNAAYAVLHKAQQLVSLRLRSNQSILFLMAPPDVAN